MVIVFGLAMLVPSLHDLLLAALLSIINWVLEFFHRPPLPKADYAPWWTGLILVLVGLLFLWLQARKRVWIRAIKNEDGGFKIEGLVESSDPADAERLTRMMQHLLDNLDEDE
jgi:hypothetical protein